MKSQNIEKVIKDFCATVKTNVKTTPEMDTQIISDATAAHQKSKKEQSAEPGPNIWRIIMKNPMTKLATAAVIIVAVMVGINHFGGPIDGSGVAFGQMKQALGKVPWVHSINNNSGVSDEGWLSFIQQIEINKNANGEITYADYGKKIEYVYSPETDTITCTDISDKKFALGTTDILAFVDVLLDKEQARGAELTRKNGLYNETTVEVWEITRRENNWIEKIKMFVDKENHLPLSVEVKSGDVDREPGYVGNIIFDYPENGPQDIYAIGVPQSAKIVDLLPESEVLEILRIYQKYRNNAPSKYAAVVIFDNEEAVIVEKNVFGYTTIIYNDEQHQYGEEYKIFATADEYADQIGDTFDSAMNWCRQSNFIRPSVIDLFDGVYHYTSKYDADNHKWDLQPRKDYPDYLGNYLEVLKRKGWPKIMSKAKNSPPHHFHIVDNNYARKYGLICIELLRQGTDYDGKIKAMPPIRELYYLNPQKDYICQRLESYRRRNAPWQEDKSWLDGIEPCNIRPDGTSITQVTEYGQTDSGKWYPKVIACTIIGELKDGTPGVFTMTETIYLETTPEFPEDIFDARNMPE